MEQGKKKLTGQHAPKKRAYAVLWDSKQYKAQPHDESRHVLDESGRRSAEAVQDTARGGGKVEERAEPGQRYDVVAGVRIVENTASKSGAVKGEDTDTQDTHIQAVTDRHGDGGGNTSFISLGLSLCHSRQEKDGDGVGNRRRKQDKRKGHSCQNAVYIQGI